MVIEFKEEMEHKAGFHIFLSNLELSYSFQILPGFGALW